MMPSRRRDITGITRPVQKHNYLIENVENIARVSSKRRSTPGPDVPAGPCDFPSIYRCRRPSSSIPNKVRYPRLDRPMKVTRDRSNGFKAIIRFEAAILYVGWRRRSPMRRAEVFELATRNEIPLL